MKFLDPDTESAVRTVLARLPAELRLRQKKVGVAKGVGRCKDAGSYCTAASTTGGTWDPPAAQAVSIPWLEIGQAILS